MSTQRPTFDLPRNMVGIHQHLGDGFSLPVAVVRLLDPLVVLLLAPMALFPNRFPREAIFLALGLLLVPFLVRLLLYGRFSAPTPANVPIAFLLLISIPVTIWTTPVLWQFTWPELIRMIWGIAMFFAVVNWANPLVSVDRIIVSGLYDGFVGNRIALLTLTFFVLGVGFASIGLLALQVSDKLSFVGPIVDMIQALPVPDALRSSQGFNANRVAGLLILFVPLSLALLLSPMTTVSGSVPAVTGWVLVKLLALLSFVMFAGAIVVTQSRAGLLATGLAVFLVCLFSGRRGWLLLVLLIVIGIGSLQVMDAGELFNDLIVEGRTSVSEDATIAERILSDRNVAGRLMLWRRAIFGISDSPLSGMGLAAFQHVAQEPYPALEGYRPDPDTKHAHNIFLQTGVDLGLPGLIAYAVLAVIAAWYVVVLMRGTPRHSVARFWSIGLLGAYAAYLIYNMIDAVTLGARPAVANWFLLGLIVAGGLQIRVALMAPGEDEDDSWLLHGNYDWDASAWASQPVESKASDNDAE